jgi:hypothetical protein
MILQFHPGEAVERAERLIEQQDRRLPGEGARDSDALRHATRQLAGKRLGEIGEPHVSQKVDNRGFLRGGR